MVFAFDGKPIDGRSLNRWYFKRDICGAQVPMIRFHDLRGSTATLLYELEEDDRVQNISGHASKAVAEESYIHKQVKHQDKAMQNWNRHSVKNSKNKRLSNRHFIILSTRHKKTRFCGVISLVVPTRFELVSPP